MAAAGGGAAVEHVPVVAIRPGHRIAVVQAVFQKPSWRCFRTSGQPAPGWERLAAGGAQRPELPGGRCGLQCSHGVFGRSVSRLLSAAGYFGFGRCPCRPRHTRRSPRWCAVSRGHKWPSPRATAAHLDPWRGTRGVFEQVAQQLAGLCRDQQRCGEPVDYGSCSVRSRYAIDGGRGLVVGCIKLDAC